MARMTLWQLYSKLLSPFQAQGIKWTPATLPYAKPSSHLPAPIPTEAEISAATKVIKEGADYHRVVSVGENFIVKYGKGVREVEGQNLLFLERHAAGLFQFPNLYAMYRSASNGYLYLVMERLEGESLETLWPRLSENDKSIICSQLRDAFAYIRRIPSTGFYGSVTKSSMPHHLFFTHDRDPLKCGPFINEETLNSGLVRKLRSIWAENGIDNFKADYYERNLINIFKNHEPVFSHSDLQRKNILLQRKADGAGTTEEELQISIIDWEEAGWYPSYWEYSIQFCTLSWDGDWPKRLETIIDPWVGESAVLRILWQELCW